MAAAARSAFTSPDDSARPLGLALGLALTEAFGLAPLGELLDDPLADPLADPLGEAEPLGLGDAEGWGCPGAARATSRNLSCAVCLTVSTRSWRLWPGISTTMLLLPWVPS